MANTPIPCGKVSKHDTYEYRFLHWASKDSIGEEIRLRITRDVADLLLLVVADKDTTGSLSFDEFKAFDWSNILASVEVATKKQAQKKIAEFEAKLSTYKTFNTPTEYTDGTYEFYVTKEFRPAKHMWVKSMRLNNELIEGLDDPRLTDPPLKMVWPMRFGYWRPGDKDTWGSSCSIFFVNPL